MGDLSPTAVSRSRLPAGTVLTVLGHDRSVMFLRGAIDVGVARQLGAICRRTSHLGEELIVDTSAMTFCDMTLLNFLGCVGERLTVTVRHASPHFLDLLAICQRNESTPVRRPA